MVAGKLQHLLLAGLRGWMDVCRWNSREMGGKREREGTCESDAERMKWNRKQSRWRGGGGGREESPSIKSCFGLSSFAMARVPSGHGLYMCVCACVGHSLSPTFSVALNHPDASAHWRDQPITAYSQHLHYDSLVAAHKGRLQGVDKICPKFVPAPIKT